LKKATPDAARNDDKTNYFRGIALQKLVGPWKKKHWNARLEK
jgi:hypothetical protein